MKIAGTPYTSLWYDSASDRVFYIDQTRLPWDLVIREMKTFEDGVRAILDMEVRGAPLIGVTAAFAMYLGAKEGKDVHAMADRLVATRPTAVNLAGAVNKMLKIGQKGKKAGGQEGKDLSSKRKEISEAWVLSPSQGSLPPRRRGSPVTGACPREGGGHPSQFLKVALQIRESELENSRLIGAHGLRFIREIAGKNQGEPVNILTHCNAGWLAAVDYGTAIAPIYLAHDSGIPVHVWVDETRPRNQGAKLTAYELSGHGVPNTLIVDNAGGHLMQQGKVDMVIVGADRITANGDVVNKIGTYLKALAAHDNGIPFYVAAPSTTFDPATPAGADVPIEERSADEVLLIDNLTRIAAPGTRVHNPGFDVTPARLVTAYITEK